MKYYYDDWNQFKQNDKKWESRSCMGQYDNSNLINNFVRTVLQTEASQGDQDALWQKLWM